jgi:integrase
MSSGIEIPIFADRTGRRRENPFKGSNVERPHINPYDRSRPLTVKQLLRMWESIGGPVPETAQARAQVMEPVTGRSLINARDRALFRIFIYTGRRSGEVARLRWQDIDDASGAYTMTWTGKGAKHDTQAMPAEVYWEIVCWLKAADRWPAQKGDYIFRAAQPEAAATLGNKVDPDRPMSTGQINNVMKKLAKRAGIDPEQVHTHTLRHSFAHVYDETKGDLNALRKILGHTSLTTTTIYLNSPGMKRPVDNYSQGFQASLGF